MRILLIAAHFPPEISGGAARPFSLYKYLPQNGIDVTVVAKRLNKETVNSNNILRFDSIIDWRSNPLFSKKRVQRYYSFIGYKFFHVYTDKYWIRTSMKGIHEFLKTNKIDIVYASYPSYEALKIGLLIKKKYKLPLVAEFRDGMVFEHNLKSNNKIQDQFLKQLEIETVMKADAIITIGERLSEYFRKTYNKEVFTVFNGFDPDEFKNLPEHPKNIAKTKIVHFGSLNASRVTKREGLFYAIQKLKMSGRINSLNFELVFIGNFIESEKEIINRLDISDLVTFLPTMDKHSGYVKIISEFNYLLFYGAEGDTSVISTKLPEYLNLGLPILGICKGNEGADIIERTGTGEVSDFDVDSIYKLLEKALTNEIHFSPVKEIVDSFSRINQASDISKIVKSIIR